MVEIANSNVNLRSPEQKPLSRIVCVFGSHAATIDYSGNAWSPETIAMVNQIAPKVLIVDGLGANSFPSPLARVVPVENLFTAFPQNKDLFIVHADMPSLADFPDTNDMDSKIYQRTLQTLQNIDPAFGQGRMNVNDYLINRLSMAIGNDVAAISGVGLAIGILEKVSRSVKPSIKPREPIQFNRMSRRDFIKIGGLTAIAAGIGLGRRQAYQAVVGKQEVAHGSADMIINTIGRVLRPILMKDTSEYVKLRNIRMGLGAIAFIREKGLTTDTAVIALGTAHKLETYPGQETGESIEQTEQRLLSALRPFIKDVYTEIMKPPPLAQEIARQTMRYLFSEYNYTDIPQSTEPPQKEIVSYGPGQFMPKVDAIIYSIFGRQE